MRQVAFIVCIEQCVINIHVDVNHSADPKTNKERVKYDYLIGLMTECDPYCEPS